jgi:hypothetical protein
MSNKEINILIKKIDSETKSGQMAIYDDNNKLKRNVANYGLFKYGKAYVDRKGEYHGLGIEAQEEIKPLLTNYRIARGLTFMSETNLQSAVKVLQLDEYYVLYGDDCIHYVISEWLKNNDFNVPSIIEANKEINDKQLDDYISRNKYDSIVGKIKITAIGNTPNNDSVVPESWLGKIFKSADELHAKMDQLDSRKGKPPVSFCCIYTMALEDEMKWMDKKELESYNFNAKLYNLIKCVYTDNNIKSVCMSVKDTDIKAAVTKYDKVFVDESVKLILIYDKRLFVEKPEYFKTQNVGVLSSRLQKCIRRGSGCIKLLIDTIKKLNSAPHYNLPNQHFTRVSGTRQLVWRSYIMIMEDVSPFIKPINGMDLLDLLSLAIICTIDTELQLSNIIIDSIISTLTALQNYPLNWDWRSVEANDNKQKITAKQTPKDRIIDSIILATEYVPMMAGDRNMLHKNIRYIHKFDLPKLTDKKLNELLKLSNKMDEENALLAGLDMICIPHILLLLQGSIQVKDNKFYTTHELSSFIWDHSSGVNYRNHKESKLNDYEISILEQLKMIQRKLAGLKVNKIDFDMDLIEKNKPALLIKQNIITESAKRLAFLLLFAGKVKLQSEGKNKPSLEIIVAGTPEFPCKVKKSVTKDKYEFLEGRERYIGEQRYVAKMEKGLMIDLHNPPIGYKWTIDKNKVRIKAKIIKSDEKKFSNKIAFYVDDIQINPFDASALIKPIAKAKEMKMDDIYNDIIKQAIYQKLISGYNLNLLMREIADERYKRNNLELYNWIPVIKKESNLPPEIWRILYTKIYMGDDFVQIGPVDGMGNKTHFTISYEYEGVMWRLLNMLYMLYPDVFTLLSDFKFELNTGPAYFHMMDSIYELSQGNIVNKNIIYPKVTIPSTLWAHQKLTADKIYDGMVKYNKKGFGDASHVGAGKTLTALALIKDLYNHNKNIKENHYSGFVIMLPSTKLYKTWIDEIIKHTKGFKILQQEANGILVDIDEDSVNSIITANTILLTTMGRMREHPLSQPWSLVIIDECLTVQNQALQTHEAWRQVVGSKYGVLMLSASFFRSRFDKMYFMLKMLKTGLPEEAEYLDAILAESMVCNITETNRQWITNIHKIKMEKNLRIQYDKLVLDVMVHDYEKAYIELTNFIHRKCPYDKYFKQVIFDIEKQRPKSRILIYTKSKAEADEISEKCDNVSRYPDKSKRHVVVSYAEGTYGLNDLIFCDTILTRPPYADYIMQMKGRLDRPGNTANKLYMEYLLLDNTVELGMLFNIQSAQSFHKHYIMPISEFYKLSVKYSIAKN